MHPPLKNDLFLRALMREPAEHTPIWLMRQAGRYLPEYNRTRQRAGSFMALAKNPEFATEVTLQPLERFSLDAAILFSDILTVPDAMGLGLEFLEGEGPRFAYPLQSEEAVTRLEVPDLDRLRYVFDALGQIRRALDGRVPLIGFSGSPFTLACYMIEGGGSSDFRRTKTMMYARPDLFGRILSINVAAVTTYLNAQIEAGAQAVMLFDTWGGSLSTPAYEMHSLATLRAVIGGLTRHHDGRRVPVISFTKGGGQWLSLQADLGADAIGLDWTTPLSQARERIGNRCALQGNLDPAILFAPEAVVRAHARELIDDYARAGDGSNTGHVFNLGHGISQFTPPESVAALVDEVHRHSQTPCHV